MSQEATQYSKDMIRIQIVDSNGNPIENAGVILLAMGQKEGQKIALPNKTNFQGEIIFNLQEHIKNINRFEITINHPDYYPYPINRNRKICRSYEYGHLCEESFAKIPAFYFNGKTLNISHHPNPIKTYTLKHLLNQDSNNQTQKEYYIQLQENSTSLKIYTDENLTQESTYTLSIGTQNTNIESTSSQSQPNDTILSFESKESLKQFKNDIQEIIIKDKKKVNDNLVHRFVVGANVPDLVAKALQYIEEFEARENEGVFSDEKLTDAKKHTNPFEKKLILTILKERIVNLVATKRYATNAALPAISNHINSYYPDQGHTSLCGPAVFFYCLLVDRPDLYVKCVIDLWEKGEAQIKNLKIKPSKSCKKPKSLMREASNHINGVDWITLAGLRDSENTILDYDEENDQVAGITLEGKIKQWFLKVGATILYSNITYGFHINKDKLLRLVAYKQQYPQSHIISLINAGLFSKKATFFKFKSHWIVWKTIPQNNGKDIDSATRNMDEIKQDAITWGDDNYKVPHRELQQYLSYNFGAMVILPIPYELGESE
ncbi:hypothetical protein [Campylobacter sp. MIT 99-7217]|uniref:hypothetical protein n=1 Tax=Campylobacter sp. MIT 99-7217 TaxID=535091 RepID=UPI0021AF8342|nr:hypothetical protein [Campylobacter sp. MIT 99-7217]